MGTARCYGQDVILTEEERRRASAALTSLNRRYENRITASAGPLALSENFADIEKRLARGETKMTGRGTLSSCGGVFTNMAVLHDGTMVPCNLLPALTMGVIGETPLQEAWLHHPLINAIRDRRSIQLNTLPGCKDCNYTDFCAGDCPAAVMAKFGKLDTVDPKNCYRLYRQQGAGNEYM